MKRFQYMSVCFFVVTTVLLSQGTPPTMSYQGYLTDNTGAPIADGSYNFTFSIYTTDIGGAALWTEPHPSVIVAKGLFNVVLGRGNPANPLTLTFDQQYFLGIRVGANPEMSPRVRLTTSAYSFRARIADGVQDGTITDASVAVGANIAAMKLQSTVLTESEIVAGSGVSISNAGGTLTISASPGAVTLGGDVTGPAASNTISNNAVTEQKIANNAVTAAKIAPNIVSSISGVSNDGGDIALVAGANVTITPDDGANTITIAAGGGGLTLPYNGTANTASDAFKVTNSGSGTAGTFVSSPGGTSTVALEVASNSTHSNSSALYAHSAAGAAVNAQASGIAPAGYFRNLSSTGNGVNIASSNAGSGLFINNSATGRGINIANTSSTAAIYVDNNSSGVGLELKQDGTGNAAYFHIDNTSSTQNCLRAVTSSTNTASDALEVRAVSGNALDAGNEHASVPTIYANNTHASTTAPIILTGGGFRTDASGLTTSPTYVASSNLGSGVPAAGGIYKDNVVCAWARVHSTGSALSSFGCSVSKTGTGQYRVTYNNPFASANDACPVVTAHYASGARFAMISVVNANYVDIETYNSSGTLQDSFFHIIVLGRQ